MSTGTSVAISWTGPIHLTKSIRWCTSKDWTLAETISKGEYTTFTLTTWRSSSSCKNTWNYHYHHICLPLVPGFLFQVNMMFNDLFVFWVLSFSVLVPGAGICPTTGSMEVCQLWLWSRTSKLCEWHLPPCELSITVSQGYSLFSFPNSVHEMHRR
jgi:hypothetical protein